MIGGGKTGWAEELVEGIALWQLFLSPGCKAEPPWNRGLKASCRLRGATVLWPVLTQKGRQKV